MSFLVILGVLFLVAGSVLLLVRQSQIRKLHQLRSAELCTISELRRLATGVAGEVNTAGLFNSPAQVTGIIRCAQPLTSEVAGVNCVYFHSEATREYETTRTETDSNGNSRQVTERQSETVSSLTRSIPFVVDDGTGELEINPEHGEIETIESADRYEPYQNHGTVIEIGSLSIPLPTGPDRTLGYRFRERALPIDRRVHVVGEATDAGGVLTIRKPASGGRLIVSLRTQEELVAATLKNLRWLLYAMLGCEAAGAALVIAGAVLNR